MKIPKVFHRIWLGPHPIPEKFRIWGETWLAHHPGWTMELWTDRNRPILRNEGFFERTTNWSNRSNLLRYEIVLDLGGVYLDTDFECLKPIDGLIAEVDFFAGCEHLPEGWIAPGLFGAVPGHPIVRELVEGVVANPEPVDYERYCATEYFTSIVRRHPEAKVFPPDHFYPYYCWELERRGEAFPDAYAVHHWAMSWKENRL